MTICENCMTEHKGEYGSGRFCSSKCARGFSTKLKRKEINRKVSEKLKGVPLSDHHPNRKLERVKSSGVTRSTRYTDEDIIRHSKKVFTLAQLLNKIGLRPTGGNYANMKRILQLLDVDTDHWTGQSWSKGQQLKDWSDYRKASNMKPHLIKKRGHQCEECKNKEWLDFPINLEIHHVDGDRTNNEETNIKLLCGNCHSTTDNFRSKNTVK